MNSLQFVRASAEFACIVFPLLAFNYPPAPTVEVLLLPWGAREIAMGGIGVADAHDNAAMYYNPAFLGVADQRWQNGIESRCSEERRLCSLREQGRHTAECIYSEWR